MRGHKHVQQWKQRLGICSCSILVTQRISDPGTKEGHYPAAKDKVIFLISDYRRYLLNQSSVCSIQLTQEISRILL